MAGVIVVRQAIPADADAIAEVYCRSWQETYAGLLPNTLIGEVANLEDARRQWRKRLEPRRGGHAAIAEIPHGPVVGFATGGAIRDLLLDYDAELTALYLLRHHHGHGVGRRLMRSVMAGLADDEFQSMVALVLTSNAATAFYRAMGGKEVVRQNREFRGVMVDETVFGWSLNGR